LSVHSNRPEEQTDQIKRFAWTLHDVFRLFQRGWARRLRSSGLGISPAQSRVMTEIHQQGGLTQTAIADSVEMEKAPLGRLLDRLEEMGLIERRPDPSDRRARLVFHTQKAESLDEPMWGAARSLFETALEGVSEQEVLVLLSILDRLKQNLLAEEARTAALRRPGEDDGTLAAK
jgi:DNA-binding MarR family transcriptional regulator